MKSLLTPAALLLVSVIVAVLGIGIAVAESKPSEFWANVGFTLAAVGIEVAAAVFVIERLLESRQRRQNDQTKAKLLRSVGHDGIGAIGRIFGLFFIGLSPGLQFNGKELNRAWYFDVETGKIKAAGFKEAIYSQFATPPGPDGQPDYDRLFKLDNLDLEVAQWMVTRALGKCYARFDLFDVDDLPISDLVSASGIIKGGQDTGYLSSFQLSMLLASLCQSVELCGSLLWDLQVFVKRDEPQGNQD